MAQFVLSSHSAFDEGFQFAPCAGFLIPAEAAIQPQ
jgi:hypothetical protein